MMPTNCRADTLSMAGGLPLFQRMGIIAFTRGGCLLARELAVKLRAEELCADAHVSVGGPERMASECQVESFDSLTSWTKEHFASDDALIFVGASGIAVRAIAPHVRDKFTDPAVVSVDEAGAFAVPLLSGHVGGANELARAIARVTCGQAAVSTATDVNGLFAVDEWAARHGLFIEERQLAKRISARLLEGRHVGFWTDCPGAWELPEGVVGAKSDLGFAVSVDDTCEPFALTLHLVPRVAVVGVGCRRDTEVDTLRRIVDAALSDAGISQHAVCILASIDVKSDEPAIGQLAASRQWTTRFFSARELAAQPGGFTSSAFVERTVGVDNVCERSVVAAGARLVSRKRCEDGVTVAIGLLQDEGCDAGQVGDMPAPSPSAAS